MERKIITAEVFVVEVDDQLVFEKLLRVHSFKGVLSPDQLRLTGWVLKEEFMRELSKALRRVGIGTLIRELKSRTTYTVEIPPIPYAQYQHFYTVERIYETAHLKHVSHV